MRFWLAFFIAVQCVILSCLAGAVASSSNKEKIRVHFIYSQIKLQKHASQWTVEEVKIFLDEVGLSDAENVKDLFGKSGIDGSGLVQLAEKDEISQLEALGILTSADKEVWDSMSAYLDLSFTLEGLSDAGSGAHRHDLLRLLEKNRNEMGLFFVTLSVSPHLALGYLGHTKLNEIVFDKEELNDEKNFEDPWSWLVYFLAPGLLAVRYVSLFMDTNPILASCLTLTYLTADLLFWQSLYGILFDNNTTDRLNHIQAFVQTILVAFFFGLFFYYIVCSIFPAADIICLFYIYACAFVRTLYFGKIMLIDLPIFLRGRRRA